MYDNGNKRKIRIDFPTFHKPNFKFNRKKISRRAVFAALGKLVIICLFFFVFIFCVSKFGKIAEQKYGSNEFNSSITYIEKQMIKYYNSGNIPQQAGDSSSLALEDLIREKIIDPEKIEKLDTCDQKNSFVTLTKIKNKKYNLKISLDCNGIVEEKEKTLSKI